MAKLKTGTLAIQAWARSPYKARGASAFWLLKTMDLRNSMRIRSVSPSQQSLRERAPRFAVLLPAKKLALACISKFTKNMLRLDMVGALGIHGVLLVAASMSNGCAGEMKAQSAKLPSLHETQHDCVDFSNAGHMLAAQKNCLSQGCIFSCHGVNIMTGGPWLLAAMALRSRPKGHHCVPGGTSSCRSPCLCQRRRTTDRSRTALFRARKMPPEPNPLGQGDASMRNS